MDNFTKFVLLPKEAQDFLAKYESPLEEESEWKSIPIDYLEQVRAWVKPLGKFTMRFRGPRYDHQRGCTRKADATRFSVYAN